MGGLKLQEGPKEQLLRDRVVKLEKAHVQLTQTFQRMVQNVVQRMDGYDRMFGGLDDLLDAYGEIVGKERVDAIVDRNIVNRSRERLAKRVDAKELALVDKIAEDSLLVGVLSDQDGKPVRPGLFTMPTAAFGPEMVAKMKDQGPGLFIDEHSGARIEVQEIYAPVPPPEPAAESDPNVTVAVTAEEPAQPAQPELP